MKKNERVVYLIEKYAGGNVSLFARRCGINPACMSRIKNNRIAPDPYYERILASFPQVSREWLIKGEGEPVKNYEPSWEIVQLREEIADLRRAVNRLIKRLDDL